MTQRSFEDSLAIGRSGERLVADFLENNDWFVIPSYDYTGSDGNKAPKMKKKNIGIVVPDLDCCRNGDRIWVEVKTKTNFVVFNNQERHGIDKKHWESYLKIQKETGCDVWLVINECSTNKLLFADLDNLKKKLIGGVGAGSFMVYFPRDSFKIIDHSGKKNN